MFNKDHLLRNIIIVLLVALTVVIALIAVSRCFIIRDKRAPSRRSVQPAFITISDEVLRSLTPSEGAYPAAVSQEALDSLAPSADASPATVNQAALDSLTPPAR